MKPMNKETPTSTLIFFYASKLMPRKLRQFHRKQVAL